MNIFKDFEGNFESNDEKLNYIKNLDLDIIIDLEEIEL